jgi:hypothetical protein
MKYLYLIIRHIFPRKRWKLFKTVIVYDGDDPLNGRLPIGNTLYFRDQFGNIKIKKDY